MDIELMIFGASTEQGFYDEKGGWPDRLKQFAFEKSMKDRDLYIPVFNLGISGDTSKDILLRMESEIKARHDPDCRTVIILSAGGNDSIHDSKKKGYWVPLEQYKENLKLLWIIAKRYSDRIIFVGLTPVDERADPVPWNKSLHYRIEDVERYNEAMKEFCEGNNVDFIDLFGEWLKEDYSKLLFDGLHPNSEGHERMFLRVREVLERKNLI